MSRARRALVPALIVAATFAAYAPVYRGTPLWDDGYYFSQNAGVHRLDGLWKFWTDPSAAGQYYPLTFTTFWAQWQLWHDDWLAYHLGNIALHAASAVLLGILLTRLRVSGAWLAAALFALHPVQVESVAWMSERKNVLAGFFFFSAALCWLRFDADTLSKARKGLFYAASLALFAAALLSKAVTATLPFALALISVWSWGRVEGKRLLTLVPHAVLGVGLGLFSAHLERVQTGANGSMFHFTLAERFLILGRASWFYLSKLVLPVHLAFIYPRWALDPGQAWQWLFPVGVVAALATAWLVRRRVGSGPLVALLFFGGVAFPALGFFNVYPFLFSFVADHFQYLACAGPLALLAHGAWLLGQRLPRAVAVSGACGLLALLGALTALRAHLFADSVRLWEATLVENPECWMCDSNLGNELQSQGRSEEALAAYRRALPRSPLRLNLENDLGVALLHLHRPKEAELYFRAGLREMSNHVTLWINLGDALNDQARDPEARAAYEEALRLKPTSLRGNTHMGAWLLAHGEPERAKAFFEQALAIDPAFAEAKDGLARCQGPPVSNAP